MYPMLNQAVAEDHSRALLREASARRLLRLAVCCARRGLRAAARDFVRSTQLGPGYRRPGEDGSASYFAPCCA